jgi:acyl-CoA dehydrogenase
MDFALDARTVELQQQLLAFMDEFVYPAEQALASELVAPDPATHWQLPPVIGELQAAARERGLWNLFLPDTTHGAGLTNSQYAPLAEVTGHSPLLAPAALNCAAPDTGNMELLAIYGTPEQQERWLTALLNADIRSAFAMTEPDVASSDASNITTSIEVGTDELVINGTKVWSTGAMNPNCELFIVMGKTDAAADRHEQQSMVLVPRDTPGVTVEGELTVFGYADNDHGGHARVSFKNARVPTGNILGERGKGFAMAQARLGPGRIHHCMRAIGMAERALQLMCERSIQRVAFGKPLARQGVIQNWIAESRIRIEESRLLVLKAAWLMDTAGNRGAHTEIQAIKVVVPRNVEWIVDKAIQTYGAAGLSQETPLAHMYAGARALRIADGPDEVHLASLARRELKKYLPTS